MMSLCSVVNEAGVWRSFATLIFGCPWPRPGGCCVPRWMAGVGDAVLRLGDELRHPDLRAGRGHG